MSFKITYDVIIVGGGLAGLCCALHLSKHGCKVMLIEKNSYPHHKVCGEYVSNEVLPYLSLLGIDPFAVGAKRISKFELSTKDGDLISSKLPLGGFGLSRYTLDNMLFEALQDIAEVRIDTVERIEREDNLFTIYTQSKDSLKANFVIGAFGKRSNLDTFMKRKFIQKRSPWLAVKAHYDYEFPNDTVALHNFEGGYCGLSRTELNAVNACYLTTFKSFKRFGNIPDFQKKILCKNPNLKEFFDMATPLFEKPLSISQISFEKKQAVENGIIMIGDSAGLIHPLCGNGMAMAIHSAKIFSEVFLKEYSKENINRETIEKTYSQLWKKTFASRLKAGRRIQSLLLHPLGASVGYSAVKHMPFILPRIIKSTHGLPLV